jgi:hypothetical protein
MHILTGINELAEEWLLGGSPKERFPIEAMFSCIENNFCPSRPTKLEAHQRDRAGQTEPES